MYAGHTPTFVGQGGCFRQNLSYQSTDAGKYDRKISCQMECTYHLFLSSQVTSLLKHTLGPAFNLQDTDVSNRCKLSQTKTKKLTSNSLSTQLKLFTYKNINGFGLFYQGSQGKVMVEPTSIA